MKKCTGCGEEKPATLEYFYKKLTALTSTCKLCSSAIAAADYRANKEKRRKWQKAYHEANKEEIAERRKVRFEANKEKVRAWKRAWGKANKEKIAASNRRSRESPRGRWYDIKRCAKKRGICFSLPFEFYESHIYGMPCHYCQHAKTKNGVDRKNNDRGYTPDNVVPCCHSCNAKKQTKPYEVFLEERLAEITK